MELSPAVIQHVANASAKLGAISALIQNGLLKPYLNKSQAYKLYGRARVDKWLGAGLITFYKDGDFSAAWRLDRLKLETLSLAESLLIYL